MERYKRPVLNFIYRMIGDAVEAEDVAVDVFVRAYRNMLKPSFQPADGQFSTWLFQIARNAAMDELRRRKRNPIQILDRDVLLQSEEKSEPRTSRTACDECFATEIGQQIAAAVARLPEDQRTVIILSEYEGLSNREIAEVMGCSEKSVEARLYRARRWLRKRLARLVE